MDESTDLPASSDLLYAEGALPPADTRLSAEDEAALVAAAQRDPAAFERLYDRYIQPVYRYHYSRCGNLAEAEDLTAQTFLAALEGLPRYYHRGHFAAWLFAIARRKGIDRLRGRQRQAPLEQAEDLPAGPDPLQQAIWGERRAHLVELIGQLPEPERDLLQLRFVAGLSFSEIAALHERSEDAVKKTLYRLLARLQSQLEAPHE